MPVCRNWQTTATQNRVEKSVWVQAPPPAPNQKPPFIGMFPINGGFIYLKNYLSAGLPLQKLSIYLSMHLSIISTAASLPFTSSMIVPLFSSCL